MSILAEYYTTQELADALGKSPRTLGRWWTERKGPPRIRVGQKVLYRKAAVDEWLRSEEVIPARSGMGA